MQSLKNEKIVIRGETVKLGQLLKIANLVGTGGEAKIRIQEGEVRVNGIVETRRGKKLTHGDRVDIDNVVLEVCCEKT